jgi:hypothetical protein
MAQDNISDANSDVRIVTEEEFNNLEHSARGNLNGDFQDVLDYLDWSINVFAGKGDMDVSKKGKAFLDAVLTLRTRFNMQISTHYLKQFCDNRKHKNQHIKYMMSLADIKTSPIKTSFKGGIVNGRRCIVPKIFDMLVTKQEYQEQDSRVQAFKEKCLAEWNARAKALEQQKLNAQKLEIVYALAEEEVSPTELEELAPDLIKQDIELQKQLQVLQTR